MSLWRPATFERVLSSYGAKITMATIGQVKDLLKKELEPLHSKLETMSTESSELRTSVQLFSDKYDDLLYYLLTCPLYLYYILLYYNYYF